MAMIVPVLMPMIVPVLDGSAERLTVDVEYQLRLGLLVVQGFAQFPILGNESGGNARGIALIGIGFERELPAAVGKPHVDQNLLVVDGHGVLGVAIQQINDHLARLLVVQ